MSGNRDRDGFAANRKGPDPAGFLLAVPHSPGALTECAIYTTRAGAQRQAHTT